MYITSVPISRTITVIMVVRFLIAYAILFVVNKGFYGFMFVDFLACYFLYVLSTHIVNIFQIKEDVR